ncbi:MAG: cytochrome c [Bacteroidetes bacterium]|nr:cytochrome c [Bacteroidota bacterium]
MRKTISVFTVLFFFVLMISCENKVAETPATDITKVETTLPDAEGAELFKANCITCHSLRYIQMQPDFPAKTWQKIVDKMRKNFGAPITDSNAKIIVDYLTTIKGKKEKAAGK